jgi:hypothetical protein
MDGPYGPTKRKKEVRGYPPAVLSKRALEREAAEIREMERRRNSPETAAAVARMMAEEKFHRQLRKLARYAISELGWDLGRWEAECRNAFQWANQQ